MSVLAISQRLPEAVDTALAWARREGWNPGLADAPCFAAADAAGFFLGAIDGRPAATISLVKYGARFAFLGLYIVDPDLRGRGHGIALWRAALATAAGRNVGLDGVVAQQDNYRRSGFRLAYRNIRFRGSAPAAVATDSALARSATMTGDAAPARSATTADMHLVPAAAVPFATLDAYDATCFPAARAPFLRAWVAMPGARALAAMRAGALAGYGVIRPAWSGWKIGPLFADTPAVADALFQGLAAAAPAGEIFLDVPEPNGEALALARRYAMTPVFETARMYTGPAPDVPLARIYGVTTFELG